jgi:hypothetical protein
MFFPQNYPDSLSKSGYIHRHSIMAASCGPMVYVRNLKCASTFFYQNFIKNWKWEEIDWPDIDWEHQHVFGHILDPVERRHKGLAEFIVMNGLEDLFNENTKFQNFIKFAPVFDEHTSSYHDTFGNFCYHIDWIPISGYSHEQVIAFTEKLMRTWGIKHFVGRWDCGLAHSGEPEKKSIVQKLKDLYETESAPDWINWYLHNDCALYNSICKKFDPNGGTWQEMSWLKI